MKKMRILSLLLVLAMAFSMLPVTALAAEEEFKVTVSIEGLTIGHGFYVEPTTLTLSEINDALEANYTGNGDLTCALALNALIDSLDMGWSPQGKLDGKLFWIENIDVGEAAYLPVQLPQPTLDMGITEDMLAPVMSTWLGIQCMTTQSAWIPTVGNSTESNPAVKNGDVVRCRFSLMMGNDTGTQDSNFTAANMDALFSEYGRQKRAGTLTTEGRENALAVMTHIDASQAETDAALEALRAAEAKVPEGIAATMNVVGGDVLNQEGQAFNLTVSLTDWDAEAGYKLMDCVMPIPEGVRVESVTPGDRISGGEMRYRMDEENGLLRIAYADLTQNKALSVSGETFPAPFFTLKLSLEHVMTEDKLNFNLDKMTLKVNAVSDESSEDYAMTLVDVSNAATSVNLLDPPAGPDFTVLAEELYRGDGADLIPTDKKVVMVRIPEWADPPRVARLVYNDGSKKIDFYFNLELTSEVYFMPTYAAVVDADMELDSFKNAANYEVIDGLYPDYYFAFGRVIWDDSHVVNAQDALAILNAWLRAGEAPLTDRDILNMNNNIDGCIDTFDVLGVVQNFVDGTPYEAFNKLQTGAAR